MTSSKRTRGDVEDSDYDSLTDEDKIRVAIRTCIPCNIKFDEDEIITVVVGKKGQKFLLSHRNLTRSSSFFQAALCGRFKEAKERKIYLSTQRAESFNYYVAWLENGEVCYPQTTVDNNARIEELRKIIGQHFVHLLDLAVLGDQLQDRHFRNAIMNSLIKLVERGERLPCALAATVCQSLPQQSPFRKLIVDIWAIAAPRSWYDRNSTNAARDLSTAPAEFWCNVAERSIENRPKKYPWVSDPCQYHEHEGSEDECKEPRAKRQKRC